MPFFAKSQRSQDKAEKQSANFISLLKNMFIIIYKSFVKHMVLVGANIFHYSKFAFLKVINVFKLAFLNLASFVKRYAGRVSSSVRNITKKPVNRFLEMKESALESIEKVGKITALKQYISKVSKSSFKKHGKLNTILNYALPIVSVVAVFSVIVSSATTQYAIQVQANGKNIGYVAKEQVADQAEEVLQDRIQYVPGDEAIEIKTKLSMKKVNRNEIISATELAEKMIESSDVKTIDAYGLYINGEFYGAVKSKSAISSTLNSILNEYKTDAKDEQVEFVDKYQIKEGAYLETGVISENELVRLLKSDKQVESHYTVVAGDSPTYIAQKVDVPYSELKALNPGIEKKLPIGSKVLLNKAVPFVSVRVNRTVEYTQSIPYETTKVNNSSMYKGEQRVITKGVEGKQKVIAKVSYINGTEEKKDIVSKEVISKPTTQKVAVGTKSTAAPQRLVSAAKGQYMWPTTSSRISSYFYEYRSGGRHKGIDIPSGGRHIPIYASRDGIVVQAGRNGNYGNCVTISHGNGYTTRYAHLSSISVRTGQSVNKGDRVGIMGNTGLSFGIHLHFEVRYNNIPQNPLNYVSRP